MNLNMSLNPSTRLRKSIPFLLALMVLFFIGWSIILVWQYPDDGIRSLTPTGEIDLIDKNGPSYQKLYIGDKVVSIDGVLTPEALPFYIEKSIGDVVIFDVYRAGKKITIHVTLAEPDLIERLRRVMPLVVAFIFWFIGVGVKAFAPAGEATSLLFSFFLAISIFLSAGQISNVGPNWTSDVYNFLVWIIGPLSVHFHLNFPQTTSHRGKAFFLGFLYIIGIIGGSFFIAWGSKIVMSSQYFPLLLTSSRLLLTICLMVVVGLLWYSYKNAVSPGVKAKIRIVVLGGVISALPLITLVFLPEALFHKALQPYAFVIIWIGILPLTYGYSIFRYHLIEIERHVNRGATYLLVVSLLIGFYLFLSYLLNQLIPTTVENQPFLNMLMVLCLAGLIVPVYKKVQMVVDTAFYGGWYDYRSAVTQITWGLEQITDLHFLAETVSERLVKTLRLEDTCVFLCDNSGDFSVIEVAPHNHIKEQQRLQLPVLPRSSLQYLLKIGREERASLVRALSEVTLSPEEHELLNSEQVHLWVPIIGHGQVKGFLALGPKYGGDIFSAEDMDILRVVARQVAPVVENIHLLTQLRQHAAELESRVRERTAELHDAKERVEAILSSVGDGVFVIDLSDTILTVNTALEKQLGYSARQLIGRNFETIFSDKNPPEILDEIRRYLQQGETWSGELIGCKKNRGCFDVYLTLAPVCDQAGRIVRYVGSQRDITHQKELDRLKDIFVADVSHELRTPTTNINLYLELLESAPEDKWKDYLLVLKEQGVLLRKLVEDILDLSRLAVGKSKKDEFLAVDLNILVEQIITAQKPWAQSKGISLVFSKQEERSVVLGNQSQLARVLTNLIANAIQYTHEGEVSVRTYSEGQYLSLEVADTGIGIDQEDMNHIFERFYRGRQVRQSKVHGTGLGLAIVKEIMDLHFGQIIVNSELGKGSKFTLLLPILESQGELLSNLLNL